MKKRILLLLSMLLMCFSFSITVFAAQDTQRLFDDADLLTNSEERKLTKQLDRVSKEYEVDILILTVDSIEPYSADQYIELFYDGNNCGYGENRDGVLLMVAMEEREYRILSNGIGADAISLSDIEDIGDSVAYYLSDGEYADAFECFIDECEYQINGEINGFPFEFMKNLLISLGIGLVVAFITIAVLMGELKSVRKQVGATEYTKPGSMQLTRSSDLYLYRTINRIKRQNESSRSSYSSSSSSRNIGGGKF